ncbi:MAG TPA: hypothetical protein VM939_06635 [Gemmatimonadaceae bacterium]|nr:hypothetical protein [Gemmatimonadaceae bacterium]
MTDADGTTRQAFLPSSRTDMEAIEARREMLSSQLNSAAGRRARLAEQIKGAPDGASRTGLEDRMKVLDKRIIQLESDIALTGQQLTQAPSELLAESRSPSQAGDIPENVMTVVGVFTVFVLFPLAIAFARRIWKRTTGKAPPPMALPPESAQRLERLEQGVEAIAIEIERISEGQRFVTRLLSEAQPGTTANRKLAQTVGAGGDETIDR